MEVSVQACASKKWHSRAVAQNKCPSSLEQRKLRPKTKASPYGFTTTQLLPNNARFSGRIAIWRRFEIVVSRAAANKQWQKYSTKLQRFSTHLFVRPKNIEQKNRLNSFFYSATGYRSIWTSSAIWLGLSYWWKGQYQL